MSEETTRRIGGLGRGLAALLAAEPGSSLREISLDELVPNPRQPRERFDHEGLAELAASIREVGVLQPIVVRRTATGYELVVGERRVRAARMADLDKIPAIVREVEDTDLLRDALIENIQREDLNPMEEATALRRLIAEMGVTHEEIAERLGRNRATITNALRLLGLAPGVRERIAGGTLSAAHGRAIAALANAEAQERVARRVVAEGLSARATEELVRGLAQAGERLIERGVRTRVERPAGVLEVEKSLSDMLDTRVRVETGRRRGRIVIEFAGAADLERIWRAIARD